MVVSIFLVDGIIYLVKIGSGLFQTFYLEHDLILPPSLFLHSFSSSRLLDQPQVLRVPSAPLNSKHQLLLDLMAILRV